MNHEKLARPIFKISDSKDKVICPPEQVFVNPNFVLSVTIGGHYIVWGDEEYQKLMTLLKEIGEAEFYILENIGATLTERDIPYQTTINVNSNFDSFKALLDSFDPPFGLMINSFFMFGKSENWGIYICELPTINIIGCTKGLIEKFSSALDIGKYDTREIENFIEKEFQNRPDLMKDMTENYLSHRY
jgi:hypothetical protein